MELRTGLFCTRGSNLKDYEGAEFSDITHQV
jgi:hypothetical protein